jgi:hypothetical protein
MRRRRAAYVAATVGAVLLVTGCSTTKSGQGGTTVTGNGSSVSIGGDTQPSPGVTDDTVKVGAIFTDVGTLGATLGFKSDPMGDPDAQVKALTTWVDANGGMGGRKLELVPKVYVASTDSPQAEEALCRSWTQDEKAFAVVITGQLQANARKCYAKGRAVMVDNASYPLDRKGYDELKPFLWAPGVPVFEDFLPQWVTSLKDQKFFDGSKRVGVIAADSPVNRRAYDSLLKPELDQAGVAAQEISYVDTLSVDTINGSLFRIAQAYKQKGVDRILFLGGARLAALWPLSAFTNGLTAPYGLSSYDTPNFFGRNPTLWTSYGFKENPAVGSAGLSFQAGTDVDDVQAPFPSTFAEQQCATIYAGAGLSFTTRSDARLPFQLCDAVLFLKAALDRAPKDLTPAAFGSAAAGLGADFQASSNYSTFLGPQRTGGPASARPMKFDTACSCMLFTGPEESLGGVPAAAAVGGTA